MGSLPLSPSRLRIVVLLNCPVCPRPRSPRRMASRGVLLPVCLLALAAATAMYGGAFVVGTARIPQAARGSAVSQRALPVEALADSSVTIALQVSQPGWAANLLGVIIPCTLLIILYLQSERTKAEQGIE